MEIEEIRKGTKVTIKQGLRKTDYLWSADSHMHYMARSGNYYKVENIVEMTPRYTTAPQQFAVKIDGYYFAPEDLELYEEEGPKEVIMKTVKEVKFDPASL